MIKPTPAKREPPDGSNTTKDIQGNTTQPVIIPCPCCTKILLTLDYQPGTKIKNTHGNIQKPILDHIRHQHTDYDEGDWYEQKRSLYNRMIKRTLSILWATIPVLTDIIPTGSIPPKAEPIIPTLIKGHIHCTENIIKLVTPTQKNIELKINDTLHLLTRIVYKRTKIKVGRKKIKTLSKSSEKISPVRGIIQYDKKSKQYLLESETQIIPLENDMEILLYRPDGDFPATGHPLTPEN